MMDNETLSRLSELHTEIRAERPTEMDIECLVISSPTARDSEYYRLLMQFFDDWLRSGRAKPTTPKLPNPDEDGRNP